MQSTEDGAPFTPDGEQRRTDDAQRQMDDAQRQMDDTLRQMDDALRPARRRTAIRRGAPGPEDAPIEAAPASIPAQDFLPDEIAPGTDVMIDAPAGLDQAQSAGEASRRRRRVATPAPQQEETPARQSKPAPRQHAAPRGDQARQSAAPAPQRTPARKTAPAQAAKSPRQPSQARKVSPAKATGTAKRMTGKKPARQVNLPDFSAVKGKLKDKIQLPDFSDQLRRILWPENAEPKKDSRSAGTARSASRTGRAARSKDTGKDSSVGSISRTSRASRSASAGKGSALAGIARTVRDKVSGIAGLVGLSGDGSGDGSQRGMLLIFAVLVLFFGVSLYKLGSYATDYFRSARISAQLREAYFGDGESEDEEFLSEGETGTLPEGQAEYDAAQEGGLPLGEQAEGMLPQDGQPDATPEETAPPETPAPTQAPSGETTPDPLAPMPDKPYPLNATAVVRERFRKLQRQNKDIVGWLTVGELLDEAIVQRDNSYYLRRDYLGYHNVNGAIFLDEATKMSTRPYTLTMYGHNMKTGAMFGCLRNYEDVGYYHKSPFIRFDSLYEDGQYVIFSVAEVSIDVTSSRYSGFYRLNSCTALERAEIIEGLCRLSRYTCPVDVNADDQILLLVTCVGEDTDRRIVAARRFRDGETEGGLYVQVHQAKTK